MNGKAMREKRWVQARARRLSDRIARHPAGKELLRLYWALKNKPTIGLVRGASDFLEGPWYDGLLGGRRSPWMIDHSQVAEFISRDGDWKWFPEPIINGRGWSVLGLTVVLFVCLVEEVVWYLDGRRGLVLTATGDLWETMVSYRELIRIYLGVMVLAIVAILWLRSWVISSNRQRETYMGKKK